MAAATGTVPAIATGGLEPSRSWQENPELVRDQRLELEIARQVPVIMARTDLEEAAAQTGAGPALVNADHAAGRLDLYWKGALPEPLRSAVERVRQRFTVVVHDAPYSWTELAQEARRLLVAARTVDGLEGLVATAVEHDLGGVRLLVPELPATPASITAQLDSHLPLRLEVTKLERPRVKPADWRWDDLPPWTGGAVIERTEFFGLSTIRCTTAFTARTADDTIRGVFSAAHCGTNESWRTAVSEAPVGVSNLWFSDTDVMGIVWQTSNPVYLGFEGRVYDGAHDSGHKRGMIGSSWSGLDDIVCTSGGFSGINCRQRVFDRNLFIDPFGGPLFATAQMDGLAAVGQGDSGGPVFAAGLSSSIAHGVISAIAQGEGRATECLGWDPDEDRECSDWALHAEIQPVLDTLGMQVIHWSESDAAGTAAESVVDRQAPPPLTGEFHQSPAAPTEPAW